MKCGATKCDARYGGGTLVLTLVYCNLVLHLLGMLPLDVCMQESLGMWCNNSSNALNVRRCPAGGTAPDSPSSPLGLMMVSNAGSGATVVMAAGMRLRGAGRE